MRVTGVRITVFCSAIVIDVIVHCHTAGALLSQTAENNCPYHRVVGFLILSGQFIITSLMTMKQWSKWSVRAEIQRWDTCQERTELRLFGHLMESMWTPKIQIKYVDTQKPTHMPTERNFTRDEWDHLLHLMNIMIFSMFACSHFLSNRMQSIMSKRAQESTAKEVSAVAETETDTDTNEFGVKEPPECEERSSARFEWFKQSGESRNGSELCFVPWQQTDTKHQPKPNIVFSREATRWYSTFQHQETGAERWIFKLSPRQETRAKWECPIRKVATTLPQHADLRSSVLRESLQEPAEKVESRKRRTSNWYRSVEDQRIDLGTNLCRLRWKPPSILDQITLNIWKYTGTRTSRNFRIYSDITQKLMLDHQAEILNVTTIDWTSPSWTRSTLPDDQVISWKKSTRSDSVMPGENVRSFRSESKDGKIW